MNEPIEFEKLEIRENPAGNSVSLLFILKKPNKNLAVTMTRPITKERLSGAFYSLALLVETNS